MTRVAVTYAATTRCPHCRAHHEAATNTTGAGGPGAGDITLCFSCGEWAVFDHKGGLRKPTEDELAHTRQPNFVKTQDAWHQMVRRHRVQH